MKLLNCTLIFFCTLLAMQGMVHGSEALLNAKCSACHVAEPDGSLSRINAQRKTPEGWNMTLFRMEQAHDMQINDDERRTLIRYLANTYGLAPSESAAHRAVLERQANFVESPPDAEMAVLCARCHTWGRVALQRRSEAEWRKHVHFHVGQYPTIEYQASARDRDWFEDALNIAVPYLAEHLPVESDAWSAWQQADKPSVEGQWIAFGHRPGSGDFHALLDVAGSDDAMSLSVTGEYSDGTPIDTSGAAVLYTGYEWRASTGDTRQVMAMSEDGSQLTGRWFEADNDSLGAQVSAVRLGSGAGVIGVSPVALRAGQRTAIMLVGDGLDSQLSAPGITFGNVVLSDDGTLLNADALVAVDAEDGPRTLAGGAEVVVFSRIDSVQVEPPEAIARVGSNGGPIPAVPAQFDAVAWANGTDGKPGTEDDLRIGSVPAEWSVEPFDEAAKHDKDEQFAGTIGAATGLFAPAGAGPNPERRFSTNNAGNLNVVATVQDGGKPISGSGHLVVTVQRFNDPPIR